jgi:ATP phosphoribosyltransferase
MIRIALPKGRNLPSSLAALRAAGLPLRGVDGGDRRLWLSLGEEENLGGEPLEVLLLKDQDLPLYVEFGVADLGVVGSDVLGELGSDLLVPLRLVDGRSRMSFIGHAGGMPASGTQVRLATKYPQTARRLLAQRPWGAEIVRLSGAIELAPMLELAEVALDIVQTGRTLRENGLEELETVAEVAPCLVVNRASFQQHRRILNDLIGRLEAAGVAE